MSETKSKDIQLVHVNAQSGSYDVMVGLDILSEVGPTARRTAGGNVAFVVSNTNVNPLYGEVVNRSLSDAGYTVATKVVGVGEAIKTMSVLSDVLECMADAQMTRDDLIVALGGGVVGDLAGFAASIYMRGCHVLQVPTSLLAMVDSSVGGKTAVDLVHGKNLAGTFFQPSAVIASIECLTTINRQLFTDSCGEVLKYGVMSDAELFRELERRPINEGNYDLERIGKIVKRCIEIKRDVVDTDEREKGLRQILNLGHTIGHAIEAESSYTLGHGSCVAAGMCFIVRACAKRQLCPDEVAQRVVSTVERYGLPTGSNISTDSLYERALADKKRHGDFINVVLVRDIGKVEVATLPVDDFRVLIEEGR
ncbi:3-dehydroquinate synthase [Olsenella sp. Marseille-P4559]|uniref:3-dehydroquinate synthase n=1 Tax=Olsenella sp. Marseille-P4559 TaxID=2364795 RepID=UPI0010316683|nr:3-dehydroquinate synthase [Olsenella sp. Marseille-P4559]